MRQQVNLYQPILRRERKVFSSSALVISLGIVIVALALVTGLTLWGQHLQQRELEALAQQKRDAEQRVSMLEERYQPPARSDALEREVKHLRREIAAKEQFLERFDPQSVSFSDGFGPWLEGLGRQVFEGIWLDRIALYGDAQMNLGGGALKPAFVPKLVERLGEEPVFRGRAFRELRVQRMEDAPGRVAFTLTSKAEAEQ